MSTTTFTAPSDGGNRSLERGLAVLDCIGRHADNGVSVSGLMRECELERATVYRILTTLVARGYVTKGGRFSYQLTTRSPMSNAHNVPKVGERLKPVLQRISEFTQDAAFAVVREGTQSHCIARHIGTFPVQVLSVEVGRRQPLGVGAAGLALLASLAPWEADEIIEANASALQAYRGMTKSRLHLLLNATRDRGWSVIGNHVVSDTLGVGVSVPKPGGAVSAAISVAAPVNRMSHSRQVSIIKAMRQLLEDMFKREPVSSHLEGPRRR